MNIDNSINYGLQLYLQKEDEHTWQKINMLFETLTPTTPDHKHLILTKLSPLIIRSMLSDRSRLSGTSLNLITKCKECNFNFDIFIEALFKLINRPNKVFSTRAENVLLDLIHKYKSKNFYRTYLKSANKNVRHCAYKVAEIIMDDIEVFRGGVTDAHPDCRAICKRVLMSKGELVDKKIKEPKVSFFQSINSRAKEVVKKCITHFSPFKKQPKLVEERPVHPEKLNLEKMEVEQEVVSKIEETKEVKNETCPRPEIDVKVGCFTPTKIQEYINKYKTKGYLASKYLSEDTEEKKVEEAQVNDMENNQSEEQHTNKAVSEAKTEDEAGECNDQNKPLDEEKVKEGKIEEVKTEEEKNEGVKIEKISEEELIEEENKTVEISKPHLQAVDLSANDNIITNVEPETVFDSPDQAITVNEEKDESECVNAVEEKTEDVTIVIDESNIVHDGQLPKNDDKSEISLIFDNNQNDKGGSSMQSSDKSSTVNQTRASTTFIKDIEHDLSQMQDFNDRKMHSPSYSMIDERNQSAIIDAVAHDFAHTNMPSFHETTVHTSLSRLSLNENMSMNKSKVEDSNEDQGNASEVDMHDYTLVGDDAYIKREDIEKSSKHKCKDAIQDQDERIRLD